MHDRIRIPRTRMGERPRGGSVPRTAGDVLLNLQQSVGNRAVTDILARDDVKKAPADTFRDAVKGKSWPAAAKALNEVPDGDVQALLKPLAAKELDLLDAASGKLKDLPLALRIRTHRHIVFLRRPAAAVAPHDDDFKVTGAGKLEGKQKAGGGEVTVRTGVEGKVEPEDADDSGDRTDAVSMSYSGPDAGKTRWLQFISREVVIPATDKAKERWVPGTTGADSGRQYALTTDPDKRVWNTDTAADSGTPFYEESGINNRTADATTSSTRRPRSPTSCASSSKAGPSACCPVRTWSRTSCATCRCCNGSRSISSGCSRPRAASRRPPPSPKGRRRSSTPRIA